MSPFKSFQHAQRFLAGWAHRTRPTLPKRAGTAQAIGGRGGLGVGGLLLSVVLSFGVVLASTTVLSVLQGGPPPRAGPTEGQGPAERQGPAECHGPAGRQGLRTPEARAGAGPDGNGLAGSRPPAGGAEGHAPASPAARARAELPGRLGEILRVREAAFARRDAGLLATIYTADCACLRSGRQAIARLRTDHAVWRGRSISVRVEELSRVDDALWIALAVLRRSAFRIEGEDGRLISAEPAARQRYRFALARGPAGTWLLGHASLVEELPP